MLFRSPLFLASLTCVGFAVPPARKHDFNAAVRVVGTICRKMTHKMLYPRGEWINFRLMAWFLFVPFKFFVPAGPLDKLILAWSTEQGIFTVATYKQIVTSTSVHDIVTTLAEEDVASVPAVHRIVTDNPFVTRSIMKILVVPVVPPIGVAVAMAPGMIMMPAAIVARPPIRCDRYLRCKITPI